MEERIDGWMGGQAGWLASGGRTDEKKDGWMHGHTDGWINEHTY